MGRSQKKKTERQLARAEEKKKRKRERLEEHALPCPHCGKGVLDHMTKCPYCGNVLKPTNGYTPMTDEQRRKIKGILTIALTAVAIVAIVLIFVFKK